MTTQVEQTQNISLYTSLKEKIISNMENRVVIFNIPVNRDIKECMDTTNQIMKDIIHTNPYEYYNMSKLDLTATQTGNTTILDFNLEYRTTKSQEDLVTLRINNILSGIIKSNMTTANKELAIHDWIVNNTQYDSSLTKFTAYNALEEHSAVCEGYALLIYKLLTQAGIPSQIVSGTADNGQNQESHAWNLVNINGFWYHLDTTWDDPISSIPLLKHDYFNLTDSQIIKDHTWDKTGYPAVSQVLFIR